MNYKLFRPFALLPFYLLTLLPLATVAQKFGHVDYGSIMKVMPGIESAQTIVLDFQTELQATGEQMAKEFKEKQTAFEKLQASSSTSPAILKIKQDELASMYRRIQEFADSMEEDLQEKQLELLEPFQTKMLAAIKKVAKAHNYVYVFDITSLMFFSTSDDLSEKVKAELGIK